MGTDATTNHMLELQRDETTIREIYRQIVDSERDPARKLLLQGIVEDEIRHCDALRESTGQEVAPDMVRVRTYKLMTSTLGPTFVLRQMIECEKYTERSYLSYGGSHELTAIALDEKRHGEVLSSIAEKSELSYISSVVLGLNDALVEFTGALSGFTLALDQSHTIALTGGITGIAAALSMASSEYLSSKSGISHGKRPLKAALCTGLTYLITVAALILPYILIADKFSALGLMLLTALVVIALFNYYYSVVRCESFKRRFLEMAALSFTIAGISFLIGYILNSLIRP